jgi:hypothetical protein
MKILKSKHIKKLSPKWFAPRGARLATAIALARHVPVDEEGNEFENALSLVPCLAGLNLLLYGVWTEPGIFRVLLNFLASANLNPYTIFAYGLLDISQSAPEMRLGGHDPQFGESMTLCPLDSSSRDAQSWRWIAGFFLGVFHRNTLFDTDVKLSINPTIFPRLLRCDFGDAPIGQNRFRCPESECDNTCGSFSAFIKHGSR